MLNPIVQRLFAYSRATIAEAVCCLCIAPSLTECRLKVSAAYCRNWPAIGGL